MGQRSKINPFYIANHKVISLFKSPVGRILQRWRCFGIFLIRRNVWNKVSKKVCIFTILYYPFSVIGNDLTERLGGCLYKCGCLVKLSILMSMMRKNHFPVVKGMHSDAFFFGPTFTICLKCILDNIPEFSKINPG